MPEAVAHLPRPSEIVSGQGFLARRMRMADRDRTIEDAAPLRSLPSVAETRCDPRMETRSAIGRPCSGGFVSHAAIFDCVRDRANMLHGIQKTALPPERSPKIVDILGYVALIAVCSMSPWRDRQVGCRLPQGRRRPAGSGALHTNPTSHSQPRLPFAPSLSRTADVPCRRRRGSWRFRGSDGRRRQSRRSGPTAMQGRCA